MEMTLNNSFLTIQNDELNLVNGGRDFWYTAGKILFIGGVSAGVGILAGPLAGGIVGVALSEYYSDAVPCY